MTRTRVGELWQSTRISCSLLWALSAMGFFMFMPSRPLDAVVLMLFAIWAKL